MKRNFEEEKNKLPLNKSGDVIGGPTPGSLYHNHLSIGPWKI